MIGFKPSRGYAAWEPTIQNLINMVFFLFQALKGERGLFSRFAIRSTGDGWSSFKPSSGYVAF